MLAFLLVIASCSQEIKTCTGRINRINDTLMTMQIGDYEVEFDMRKARYTNGAVMRGDSVNVDYVGELRDKKGRALIVCLVPPEGTVIEAVVDTTKELITAPMSEEDARRLDEFVKNAKK